MSKWMTAMVAMALAATLGLSYGCEDDDVEIDTPEGQIEIERDRNGVEIERESELEQDLEEAGRDTREALKRTGETIKDGAREAAEETGEALERAGEELKDPGQ